METNKELLQFIMEEVEKLHRITLLETRKLEIEGQLRLLKEEDEGDSTVVDENAITDYNDKKVQQYYDSQNNKSKDDAKVKKPVQKNDLKDK